VIVAGVDQTGVQLYQVDPSGTFMRGSGFAIGQSADVALSVLQQEYGADMSVEQAVALSNKAIERALGERPVIEVGVVSTQEKQFQKLR
jgi:proteasome alpha subunit